MILQKAVHSEQTEEAGVTTLQHSPEAPNEHLQECPSNLGAPRGEACRDRFQFEDTLHTTSSLSLSGSAVNGAVGSVWYQNATEATSSCIGSHLPL